MTPFRRSIPGTRAVGSGDARRSTRRVFSRTPLPPRKGTMHRIVDSRCVLAVRDLQASTRFYVERTRISQGFRRRFGWLEFSVAGCVQDHARRMSWREASKRARGPLVHGIPDRRGRRSVSCGSRRARSRRVIPTCDRTLGPAGVQHPHTGRTSHPIRRTNGRGRLTAIGAGGGSYPAREAPHSRMVLTRLESRP